MQMHQLHIHTETKKIGDVVHTHKVCGGISYHRETADEVIRAFCYAYENKLRIRVFYGDFATGEACAQEYDIMGRVGRTTGQIKAPIMVHNARSMGGGIIDAHRVVGVRIAGSRHWLWKHPKFSAGEWAITPYDPNWPDDDHLWSVLHNGEEYARERSKKKALRLAEFMRGDRDSK